MSIKINIKRYDKRIEKILLYILNNSLEFLQSSCRVNVVYRGLALVALVYTKRGQFIKY